MLSSRQRDSLLGSQPSRKKTRPALTTWLSPGPGSPCPICGQLPSKLFADEARPTEQPPREAPQRAQLSAQQTGKASRP